VLKNTPKTYNGQGVNFDVPFLQQNKERQGQNNQPAYLKHAARTDKSSSKPSSGSIKRTGDRKKNGTKTVRTDTAKKLFYLFFNKTKSGTDKNWVSSVVNIKQQETKVRKRREQEMAEKTHVLTVQQKPAILEKLVTKRAINQTTKQQPIKQTTKMTDHAACTRWKASLHCHHGRRRHRGRRHRRRRRHGRRQLRVGPFSRDSLFSCPSICWKATKEEGVRETKSKKGNQPDNTKKQ
jgi:hypothetical protein